jgi:hypothetical protein
MFRRHHVVPIAAVVGLAFLSACASVRFAWGAPRPRPPGQDCVRAYVVVKEANGGTGKEFDFLESAVIYQDAPKPIAYAACPAERQVPPDVARAWLEKKHPSLTPDQERKANGARPVDAHLVKMWTEPKMGVLYKYSEYALYFQGCDFWMNDGDGSCAPPGSSGPAGGATEGKATASDR